MTISNETTFTGPLIANGITTAFPFTFAAMGADEIEVFGRDLAGATVTLPDFDAMLSGDAPATGTITFVSPPADGLRIWIASAPDFRQEIAFEDGSRWLAGPVNEANDRAATRALALRREADRAVKLPIGEPGITLPGGSGPTLYTSVNRLAGIAEDIETVAARDTDIATVADRDTDIGTIATAISHVSDVGSNIEAILAVDGNEANIAAVVAAAANISTVAGISDGVEAVASISAMVTAVADDATDIGTVAGIASDVTNVANVAAEIGTLSPIAADITIVAGLAADIPNATAYRTISGRGVPDATTTETGDGSFYLERTVGWLFGPKTNGAWPSVYANQGRIVGGVEPCAVVFFMGQSNVDGFSTDPINTTALTAGYGYEYYCDATGIGSVLPLGPVRLGRLYGGPQSAFAQTWAAGGGGAVVAVDCAAGGSSMASSAKPALTGQPSPALLSGGTWDQSDPANIYARYILPHMRLALTEISRNGFDIRRQIVYWSQGEQDALGNISQANHEAALRAFLRQLKRDFPSIWFLIERLGHNRDNTTPAQHANIRNAQTAVATDPEFSGWVKICSTLAEGFQTGAGNPDFADTLHYSQPRYNDLGAAMATAGLAFAAADYALPVPTATKWNDLLANLPLVPNWYRCAIKTKASGAFALSSFNDPSNNYCTTFYDTTWANRNSTAQTLAFTFPDGSEKELIMYVHKSATGDTTITGTSTSAVSDLTFIDQDFPVHTIALSGTGVLTLGATAATAGDGASFSFSDLYRMSTAKLRTIAIGTQTNFVGHVLTNALLDKMGANLTSLDLDRAPLTTTLDLTKCPNLTRHNQARSGLSVAEVNARLIALDANGKTNGQLGLSQFVSGVFAHSVPTGAGATAKSSLQSKGWTVSTD